MKHCPEGQIPETWTVATDWDFERERALEWLGSDRLQEALKWSTGTMSLNKTDGE